MRSTMLFGNKHFSAIQFLSTGSRNSAKAISIFLATSPLLWMLSQDMRVNGASPRMRLLLESKMLVLMP